MNLGQRTIVGLVRGYQWLLSPLLPPSCRFEPTCSHYAVDAVRAHGAGRGVLIAGWRLLRCNPWNSGGYDPVPERPAGRQPEHRYHRRTQTG